MENNNVCKKRSSFGIFLIIIGIIWILLKLGIIPSTLTDILISWQMLLIAIGAFSLIAGNRTSGTILILTGTFFLAHQFIHIPRQIRQIGWPLFIIGIGIALLLNRRTPPSSIQNKKSQFGIDFFDDFVIFGSKEVFINSLNFLGGKITSIFGGAEYDLRKIKLSDDGAFIDAVCVFGGCGFKVPPNWTIKNEVNAIFGGFTDKRDVTAHEISTDPSKTIVIRGFCIFGGIEIKYN